MVSGRRWSCLGYGEAVIVNGQEMGRVKHERMVEVLPQVVNRLKGSRTIIWRVPFMKMPGKVE